MPQCVLRFVRISIIIDYSDEDTDVMVAHDIGKQNIISLLLYMHSLVKNVGGGVPFTMYHGPWDHRSIPLRPTVRYFRQGCGYPLLRFSVRSLLYEQWLAVRF